MSPFSLYLVELRNRFGLRQGKFAEMLGYEQSYVSALELGLKGPSNKEFLSRLVRVLQLNVQDQEKLARVLMESQQRFVLPRDVSPDTFRMCSELWDKIDRLPMAQIAAIRAILAIESSAQEHELVLKAFPQKQEAPM